jgi:hypothetical protein
LFIDPAERIERELRVKFHLAPRKQTTAPAASIPRYNCGVNKIVTNSVPGKWGQGCPTPVFLSGGQRPVLSRPLPKFLKITGINRGEPDQCSGYYAARRQIGSGSISGGCVRR